MERELRITKDGSHSIYIPEMDEQYHSLHGSIVEAQKVYLEYGLEQVVKNKQKIKLFEMGFGTGLNALLTYLYARDHNLQIDYHTLEKYPLSIEELEQLNYASNLNIDSSLFFQIHKAQWEELEKIDDSFSIHKSKQDLREVEFPTEIDLVYFDAFAPEKQPHLWTDKIFQKIYDSMSEGGILTTYCVKGEIRRRLISIGFEVEKLTGPVGGKREVLRAVK